MKIRSLLLGSVAAAGLSTGAFAADLGVLTSLDVCDALGLSGLTISSDTNCLQITGEVKYEFRWGDFRNDTVIGTTPLTDNEIDLFSSNHDDSAAHYDWYSKVEAWLKFVATADSDIGPAKAVIKLKGVDENRYTGTAGAGVGVGPLNPDAYVWDAHDDTGGVILDEAYVSIGDSTVLMVGKKGSIANFGDSIPFNFLSLFAVSEVDPGVLFDSDDDPLYLGGHVIQITSDLGNGLSVSLGLENLEAEGGNAAVSVLQQARVRQGGTVVGVLNYAGDGITAHLTAFAGGVLDGVVEEWGVHAGATGEFDAFKVRAAVGYFGIDDYYFGEYSQLHAMLSVAATFDIFTIALSGEYAMTDVEDAGAQGSLDVGQHSGFGIGGSIGAAVTDGVEINLGARWFSDEMEGAVDNVDTIQVAAKVVADITETIKATGEVGAYFLDESSTVTDDDTIYYGALEVAWAPGGGFTSSIKGEINSIGQRITFKAGKTFE